MGESIYKPLIDAMQWSYSRLKSFEQCRYAWYLKYLYGLQEKPNFYASYGSFVHKLIEKYYRDEISHQDLFTAFLVGFPFEVKGRRPKQNIVEKYLNAGASYFKNFRPFPFQKISVEEKIGFSIGSKNFIGFIDLVGEKDGDLIIIDHKSRDLKPRGHGTKPTAKDAELDEFLKQLYLYSVGIEQKYGRLPKKLCFNCFKCGNFIEEDFDCGAYGAAKEWALETISKIETTEDFYPNLDWFYCTNLCGFRDNCCYYELIGGGYHQRK